MLDTSMSDTSPVGASRPCRFAIDVGEDTDGGEREDVDGDEAVVASARSASAAAAGDKASTTGIPTKATSTGGRLGSISKGTRKLRSSACWWNSKYAASSKQVRNSRHSQVTPLLALEAPHAFPVAVEHGLKHRIGHIEVGPREADHVHRMDPNAASRNDVLHPETKRSLAKLPPALGDRRRRIGRREGRRANLNTELSATSRQEEGLIAYGTASGRRASWQSCTGP
eukprot:CAMPEP_0176129992 /NCGR_PEP_ID=MMETSP0120_2-20121206/65755_1 /TAXON_ID=160619 /ORGANISM="Kryptoperidinium foliaceum, Strain CCMP 1326" /LENGTH=226 /DNA_ID=CAMNT_0017465243 /DNA_START=147 /DNA_END=826 /DNA_ORIENTATION=+